MQQCEYLCNNLDIHATTIKIYATDIGYSATKRHNQNAEISIQ